MTMLTIGLAAVLATWQFVLGRPLLAAMLFCTTSTLHAWILLAEFALMRAINRSDHQAPASVGQLASAWWGETCACAAAFGWRQAWRSQALADHIPDAEGARQCIGHVGGSPSRPAPSRRGVLLVHGLLCNRGLWNPWMRNLVSDAVPCMAITLEPIFGSIDEYPRLIEDAVAKLEEATGLAPVVVAHSMGGLAVRRWWVEQPAERLHHLITLGTPHHGTWLGRWAQSVNGRQMRLNSRWLEDLARRELERAASTAHECDPRLRTTCFYSHCDNIVFPARTATLPGANNVHLAGTAHIQMINHPEVQAQLRRVLC